MSGHVLSWRRVWGARKGRTTAAGTRRWSVLVPLFALGGVLLIAIVIRLVLDPLATHETRKALDGMDGFRGDFERVHVSVFRPGYDITRLKITEAARHSGETSMAFRRHDSCPTDGSGGN